VCRGLYPERGFIIQPKVEAPGFTRSVSNLGQPALTISNPKWLQHRSHVAPPAGKLQAQIFAGAVARPRP
jgi:hypothetical protein